jgi:hypothetical protein
MSNARIAATMSEFNIASGDRLVECVRDGVLDLDLAYLINIALPSAVKAWPPDLQDAAATAAKAANKGVV